jgi:D-alanine-D-alanine ligase
MTDRPSVVVLFGGPSAEHDVSIVSGTAIAAALAGDGFDVSQVVIDLDGAWWWLPAGHQRADRTGAAYDDPRTLEAEGPYRVGAAIDRLAALDPAPVVAIALHGPFGEDGTIQALLEAAGLAYTGAGVAASAVGMDKALFKRLCRGLGLPVADWREVAARRWARERDAVRLELEAFAAGAGDPRLMVKPARLGSSVGMTLVHRPPEIDRALDTAFRYDSLALVETYLPGARDIEVYYDSKYTPGLSETSTRAELNDRERATILKIARDAYRAIGAEGFARVDFLMVGEQVYLSEINTIPGFTPISLFPTMPSDAGVDFTAVCRRTIELALERHRERVARRMRPADLPR